jgi:hypothetical protein
MLAQGPRSHRDGKRHLPHSDQTVTVQVLCGRRPQGRGPTGASRFHQCSSLISRSRGSARQGGNSPYAMPPMVSSLVMVRH